MTSYANPTACRSRASHERSSIAGVLTARQLKLSCHRAEVLRHLDVARVESLLASGRARGARYLRAALATLAPAPPDITRSELEERFLALVADAALPRPEVNAVVADQEVDFVWHRQRLVVETAVPRLT